MYFLVRTNAYVYSYHICMYDLPVTCAITVHLWAGLDKKPQLITIAGFTHVSEIIIITTIITAAN